MTKTAGNYEDDGYSPFEIEDGFDAAETHAQRGFDPSQREIRDVGKAAASNVVLGEFNFRDYDYLMSQRHYRVPVLGRAAGHLALYRPMPAFDTDLGHPN